MKTTTVILEYLVSGTLALIALILFFYAVDQEYISTFANDVIVNSSKFSSVFIFIYFSLAYSIGITIETISLKLFEGFLHKKAIKRLTEFYNSHKEIIKKSFFFKGINFTNLISKTARDCYGKMRFHILNYHPSLYTEIESQINRMRLVRVLFLIEVIFIISLIILLIKSFNVILLMVTILIIVFTFYTFKSMLTRFDRYFRSIERSYLISQLEKTK